MELWLEDPHAWARLRLHPLNPWSDNPGVPAYAAVFVVITAWWCTGNIDLWSQLKPPTDQRLIKAAVASGTIVDVSIGLTAITLALSIMLGQTYSRHAGRLRVFLHVSRVELSLVATVWTGILVAALGGQFRSWVTLLGLGGIALLSCPPIFKVLNLLQHQEQFVEVWKEFTTSRQRAIASQSARRQEAATAARTAISGWGNDVKIEDRFFERFHGDDLSAYLKVPAGNVGKVDAIDLSSLYKLLDMLRKPEASRADKGSPASKHTDALCPAALVTSSSESCSSQPILIICYLPGSTVDDPEKGLVFFRTDTRLGSDQRRKIAHALRRSFRIDNSERISETITDLQSETTELCDDIKKGIPSSDRQPVERFRQMSLGIVAAAGTIRGLDIPGIVHDDYIYRVRVLARATDDARRLVKNLAAQVDRDIRDLVLSLSSDLAYSAAETGNPEVFGTCLFPLRFRCEDALEQNPVYQEVRHQGLLWYGILSSFLQRLAEQRMSAKTSIEPVVAEAKLLLQNLSLLLLSFARKRNWAAVTAVLEEISALEAALASTAKVQTEYATEARELVSLTYYGLHACLVDLAVQHAAAPTSSALVSLVEETDPSVAYDLLKFLGIYNMAKAEADADASWNWGWEPEPVSGVGFFPRADEILIRGFVATVITWPELALFQDSDTWRASELEKLEQAAGGASELGQLFGAGSLLEKTLKDAGEIAKLVAATGQKRGGADRVVGALRKLLDYVQAKTADEERARIQNARVSTDAIQGWPESVVQRYDTSHKPEIAILEKLRLLLPTGTELSDVGKEYNTLGFNELEDKQWFLGREPESWTDIGKKYADRLLRKEQEAVISWLTEISSPVDLASVVAHESPIDDSKAILVVNSGVYLLPPGLKTMVEIPESANPDHGDPDASFDISGRQIPMYQFFGQGMKSCLLFINSSNSAHTIPIPWKGEDGWTLSKTGEVKARLRVPSQDAGAMDELLGQHAPWLEEKAHTDEERKACLSGLVWPEAFLQLAFDAGATPSVLRLDLPSDEPDVPPQAKDESPE